MRRSMTCKGVFAKTFAFAALVAFVDLGSLGIYGECHTSKFNKDAKDKPERFRRIARTHLSLFRRYLPNTYLVMSDDMDVNAGAVVSEGRSLDDVAEELYGKVMSVAAGEPSRSEALGHREFFLGYKHFDCPRR